MDLMMKCLGSEPHGVATNGVQERLLGNVYDTSKPIRHLLHVGPRTIVSELNRRFPGVLAVAY